MTVRIWIIAYCLGTLALGAVANKAVACVDTPLAPADVVVRAAPLHAGPRHLFNIPVADEDVFNNPKSLPPPRDIPVAGLPQRHGDL
jgi:hypothetical protein